MLLVYNQPCLDFLPSAEHRQGTAGLQNSQGAHSLVRRERQILNAKLGKPQEGSRAQGMEKLRKS